MGRAEVGRRALGRQFETGLQSKTPEGMVCPVEPGDRQPSQSPADGKLRDRLPARGLNNTELTFWEKATIVSPVPLKAVGFLLLTGVLLLAAYYFSLFAIHGFSPDFLKINSCVESGGRWNAAERRCERVPDVYVPPDPSMQPF